MHDKVARAFATGALDIDSDIQRIPYVGAWLAPTIADQVNGHPARASLRELLAYLSRPGDDTGNTSRPELIAGRVGMLCQNRRPNVCLTTRSPVGVRGPYYVRDSNKACSIALPTALLRALARGDPHIPVSEGAAVVSGLQAAITRVQSRATVDHRSAAASCPCERREGCEARDGLCRWVGPTGAADDGDGQCVPADEATPGFEGILPFTGQKENRARDPGLHARGDYGPMQGGDTRWRRPAILGKISAGAQSLAWTISPRSGTPDHALSGQAFSRLSRAVAGHAASGGTAADLVPVLNADRTLHGPELRTADGASLSPAARAAVPVAVKTATERHLHGAFQEGHHRTRAAFVEGLPPVAREEVERRLAGRRVADTRPDWKRGLDTRTRSQLKIAVRRHPDLSGDALVDAVAHDASVGDHARQSVEGRPLTLAAARYVLETRRHE